MRTPDRRGRPLVSRETRRAASHARAARCSSPPTRIATVQGEPGRADAVPLRPSPAREIDAVGAGASAWGRVLMSRSAVCPNDVVHATRLPFDPGSPTVDCADPQRSPSYVEGRWSPSSGHACGKRQAKANANCQRYFRRATLRSFSLRRGLDSI